MAARLGVGGGGSLGGLCGQWVPADAEALRALVDFREEVFRSKKVAKPVRELLERVGGAARIEISEDSVTVGFGTCGQPVFDGLKVSTGPLASPFMRGVWHQSLELDGEWHSILALPSVQYSSLGRWRCQQREIGRLVLRGERPGEGGSSCIVALEPEGQCFTLRYEKDGFSTELRWARTTDERAHLDLLLDVGLLPSRKAAEPLSNLQARAIPEYRLLHFVGAGRVKRGTSLQARRAPRNRSASGFGLRGDDEKDIVGIKKRQPSTVRVGRHCSENLHASAVKHEPRSFTFCLPWRTAKA